MSSGCEICGAASSIQDGEVGTEVACARCSTTFIVGESGLEPLVAKALREVRAARNRPGNVVWRGLLASPRAPAYDDCGAPFDCSELMRPKPPARDSLAPIVRPNVAGSEAARSRRWWVPIATLVLGAALATVPRFIAHEKALRAEAAACAPVVAASAPVEPAGDPGGLARAPAPSVAPEARADRSPEAPPVAWTKPSVAVGSGASALRVEARAASEEGDDDPYGTGARDGVDAATQEPPSEAIGSASASATPNDSPHAAPTLAPTASLDNAIASAAGTRPEAPGESSRVAAPHTDAFDRGAAMVALGRAASAATSRCRTPGLEGRGTVVMTFAPSGNASNVSVSAPFAGTPVGECIAAKFQSVVVPAFTGSAMTIRQTITFE